MILYLAMDINLGFRAHRVSPIVDEVMVSSVPFPGEVYSDGFLGED